MRERNRQPYVVEGSPAVNFLLYAHRAPNLGVRVWRPARVRPPLAGASLVACRPRRRNPDRRTSLFARRRVENTRLAAVARRPPLLARGVSLRWLR